MFTLKPLAVTSLTLGVGLALGGCAVPTGSEPSETTSAALVEDEMKQPIGQEQPLPGQEQGQQGQPGMEQDVLIDPETGEPVLNPETGEPIRIDPETGEPLGDVGPIGQPGEEGFGQMGEEVGESGEQTGEAPAAATFYGGRGWGRPGWGHGGWGWGRPGWGRGGWGRPGWGRGGWGWGRPGWGHGRWGWGRGWW